MLQMPDGRRRPGYPISAGTNLQNVYRLTCWGGRRGIFVSTLLRANRDTEHHTQVVGSDENHFNRENNCDT